VVLWYLTILKMPTNVPTQVVKVPLQYVFTVAYALRTLTKDSTEPEVGTPGTCGTFANTTVQVEILYSKSS
jgi:hypothetical protein